MIGNTLIRIDGSLPPGLQLLLNYPTTSNVTKAYVNFVATVTGTSGTNTLTSTGTITNLIQAGEIIRVAGTDLYTVATASAFTITTVETLSTNYAASSLAVDRVSQWNDTSGKGNHATQASTTVQPVFSPSYLNGNAALIGDGSTFLSLPSALFAIPGGNNTIFIVGKRNAETATSASMISMGVAGVSLGYQLSFNATAGSTSYRSGNTTLVRSGGTSTNNQIMMGIRNGIIQRSSINNGTEATDNNGANPTTPDFAKLFSGDSVNFLTGSISKVLIWNRVLSENERLQTYKILATETGITIS